MSPRDTDVRKTDKELTVPSCLQHHPCPWCRHLGSELQLAPEDLEGERTETGGRGSEEGSLGMLTTSSAQGTRKLGEGCLLLNPLFPLPGPQILVL